MKIGVVAAGSWGDILPFIPPIRELERRGHQVVFVVPPMFARPLRRSGITAVPAGPFMKRGTLNAMYDSAGVADRGSTALEFYWNGILVTDAGAFFNDLAPVAEDVDALLLHYHSLAGYALRSRLHIPSVSLAWGPACIPSDGYPPPRAAMVVGSWKEALSSEARTSNRAAWQVDLEWARAALDPGTNRVLRELAAPPLDAAPFSLPATGERLLLASYPEFLADQTDWPAATVQVGYPYADEVPGTTARVALHFIEAGRPPVLISFGTAVAGGMGAVYRKFVLALLARGERIVALGPPLDVEDVNLCQVPYAPISQLVGRCSFMVHHGGPGTTHAALVTGTPSIAVPQFLDQPLNAAVLTATGAGLSVRWEELSLDALEGVLDFVAAPEVRDAAATCASVLSAAPAPEALIADHVESICR